MLEQSLGARENQRGGRVGDGYPRLKVIAEDGRVAASADGIAGSLTVNKNWPRKRNSGAVAAPAADTPGIARVVPQCDQKTRELQPRPGTPSPEGETRR